jgi:phosphoglycolate phosphatase
MLDGMRQGLVGMVLFWDIDGTLLTTARAGAVAWEAAVRALTRLEFDLSAIRIAGLTDYQIAERTLETLGLEASATAVDALVRAYEERVPASLPLRPGHVMPHVRDILDCLAERRDVRSYLLTGNTREGARAKLTYYGLGHYFVDGAFAEDASDRTEIAIRGVQLARRLGPVTDGGLIVIGDTPHDIRCATAIGARTIAVATGGYTVSELEPERPWRLFAELPPADEFVRLLDEARAH